MNSGGIRYFKGDRVRHPTKESWGLGELLEDSDGESVRVFFEGAGEKLLGLAYVQPVKVTGAEAESTLLDNLHLCKSAAGVRFKSLPESIQYFLKEFPGGFHGERLYKHERKYKEAAHALAEELLEPGLLRSLLDGGQYDEICTRALKVVNATNLVFPNEKMQLKDGLKPSGHPAKFAKALVDLLYGGEAYQHRFERFATMLEEIDSAKWTVATYFPFFVVPAEHMFLKPMVTQSAAELCGFEISYDSKLNWKTYDRLLAFSYWLFDELVKQELKPRDMIDVQSFIWCIAPGKYE